MIAYQSVAPLVFIQPFVEAPIASVAAVPVPVLSAALYQRFSSRGEADYGDKLLSAMRAAFGGHHEKA